MNILGCLDRPSSGSYHFAGHDVAELDSDEQAWLRREAFGFVFQGYHLIPSASAQENVEMPAIYAGTPASERHTARGPCSSAWAWQSALPTVRTSCPAASSSGYRSPAR